MKELSKPVIIPIAVTFSNSNEGYRINMNGMKNAEIDIFKPCNAVSIPGAFATAAPA